MTELVTGAKPYDVLDGLMNRELLITAKMDYTWNGY